jgi:hypothetical protein
MVLPPVLSRISEAVTIGAAGTFHQSDRVACEKIPETWRSMIL